MRRLTLLITLLSAFALTVGPASAFYDDDREIEFVPSQAFFSATGLTGISNVDAEIGDAAATWTDDIAAASPGQTYMLSHAGLGSIFLGDDYYERQSFVASGTFTGHLDNVMVDMYSSLTPVCTFSLSFDVTIDDVKVMDMAGIGATQDVTSFTAGDYAVAQFGFTEMHEAMETFGLIGDATTEHTLEIVGQMYPLCTEAIFEYGADETPSRLSFNVDPGASAYRFPTKFDVTNPPQAAE